MDKAKKNIAAAYKSLQLAKLELDRLAVIGRDVCIPNTEAKVLMECEKIAQEIRKNVKSDAV